MNCLMAEMTWRQVAQAVAEGATTVILPLGATEQHGPHLPLGTDTIRAVALAERLAERIPGSLVAPVLPIGCSDEHSGFAGLLSLDHETLASVIVDCARRMVAWGIRRLIILSAHGGNDQAIALALRRLHDELPPLRVWVPSSKSAYDALLAEACHAGLTPESVGIHAGEGETSELLHLRPELVRLQFADAGYTGDMIEIMEQLSRPGGLANVTTNGVLGDPSAARGDRGARYLQVQIEDCAKQLIAADND